MLSRADTCVVHNVNCLRSLAAKTNTNTITSRQQAAICIRHAFSAQVAQMAECCFLWNNQFLTISPTSEELNDKGERQWHTAHIPAAHLTF